jgi:chaperonin cofactor prefoldin
VTDDIVTRLRGKYAGQLLICTEAADEIERLRMTNTELAKMFKQVGVVAEIWQKTEDELIELHHGKCAEQFAKQHDEIERLRAELQSAHSQIAMMATAQNEEEPF